MNIVHIISFFILLDLYIDTDKKSYNALGFKRFGFFGLFPAVLSAAARAAQAKAKLLGMSGNMAGDGYQNGGALIVGVNGETLFHYVQEGAPDHASNLDLLKVSVLLCIYKRNNSCQLIKYLFFF